MKEQKVLDKFCRKLVAMDMDIFGLRGMAKDADPNKKSDWITMNGTPVFVGKGETPKEAGKRFAAKKESERASSSPTKNDDNDWVHPDTYGAANPENDDEDNWTHEDPWKDNGIMENSNERRALHNEKETSSHQDFVKALNDNLTAAIYEKNKKYQAEKDPQRKELMKQDLDNATKVLDYLWKNGGDIDDATMKTIWDKFDNYWKSSGEINNKLNPMFYGE